MQQHLPPNRRLALLLCLLGCGGAAAGGGPAGTAGAGPTVSSVNEVPANLGTSPHPAQVAGSSQLGSLGNQGYAGPCCVDHLYEWILYALDVASLPGSERLSTAQIRIELLLAHDVAQSKPVMMRIMP